MEDFDNKCNNCSFCEDKDKVKKEEKVDSRACRSYLRPHKEYKEEEFENNSLQFLNVKRYFAHLDEEEYIKFMLIKPEPQPENGNSNNFEEYKNEINDIYYPTTRYYGHSDSESKRNWLSREYSNSALYLHKQCELNKAIVVVEPSVEFTTEKITEAYFAKIRKEQSEYTKKIQEWSRLKKTDIKTGEKTLEPQSLSQIAKELLENNLLAPKTSKEKIEKFYSEHEEDYKKYIELIDKKKYLTSILYTSNLLYKQLNNQLLIGKYDGYLHFLSLLMDMFKELPIHIGVGYKGIRQSLEDRLKLPSTLVKGSKFLVKEVWSLSLEKKIALKFSKTKDKSTEINNSLCEIELLTSRHVEILSVSKYEQEVTLSPYTILKVVDIRKNYKKVSNYYKLKEINALRATNNKMLFWIDGNLENNSTLIQFLETQDVNGHYFKNFEDFSEFFSDNINEILEWKGKNKCVSPKKLKVITDSESFIKVSEYLKEKRFFEVDNRNILIFTSLESIRNLHDYQSKTTLYNKNFSIEHNTLGFFAYISSDKFLNKTPQSLNTSYNHLLVKNEKLKEIAKPMSSYKVFTRLE